MSMHLKIPAYTCNKCKTEFIAYSKGLSCPKCGKPEESNGEGYNFIKDQVSAMIWHKNDTGQFRGRSWGNFSLCDAVQWSIFTAFDYAAQNPDIGWEDWSRKIFILDGDGKELFCEEYFYNLCKAIDEGLKSRADEIRVKDVFDKKSGKYLPETDKSNEIKNTSRPKFITAIIETFKNLFNKEKL